jgi:predicted DNA binding CopG/RHH family protein
MKNSKNQKRLEKSDKIKKWIKATEYFEGDTSFEAIARSTPESPEEYRQIFGAGKRKPISIRIPESDLAEIQKIADETGRKYQQLIVQAVELYIDNYHRMIKMKRRLED